MFLKVLALFIILQTSVDFIKKKRHTNLYWQHVLGFIINRWLESIGLQLLIKRDYLDSHAKRY